MLEGFHAVKHALRFGADITLILAADMEATLALAAELAPDLVDALAARAVSAERAALRVAAPHAHTSVVAVAARPRPDIEAAVRDDDRPLVLLEDPRDLGNVGAVVRVAAAADVAGVLTTGPVDPWDPAAVRGSAGLHFALPVAHVDEFASARPLIGLYPGGELLDPQRLPVGAVLAFGTERRGLTPALLARCDARVAIPMRRGVSSLNLATSVAAALFAWRLRQGWSGGDVPGPAPEPG